MKGDYRNRKCVICGKIIPAKEKYCKLCKIRQGRENKNRGSPGSWKNYIKPKSLKDLSRKLQKHKK